MIARTIRVSGMVQGVWFRDWTVQTAHSLGINGWVRNRHDGSVEVLAVGEPLAVDLLIEHLREGPPAAKVARVDVEEAPVEPLHGFGRRPTV